MRLLSFIALCCSLFFLRCGPPQPTFNPFDPIFAVDMATLYKDSTLEIVGDCSAYRLIKDHGQHSTNYGIYIYPDRVMDSVVSKGLTIPLSTPYPIKIVSPKGWVGLTPAQHNHTTAIKRLPFDTVKVDSILRIYELTRVETFSKRNTFWDRDDYFLVCQGPQQQTYIFEYQFDPIWLSGHAVGKRKLVFETTITKESLEEEDYYQPQTTETQ
ncbi:MAG: hypothetical protein ACRBFS_18050 [Aureispira sp.]